MTKSKVPSTLTDKRTTTMGPRWKTHVYVPRVWTVRARKKIEKLKKQNRQERMVSSSCYVDHLASDFLFFLLLTSDLISTAATMGVDR